MKSFDILYTKVLLSKLYIYGFRGQPYDLLKPYLTSLSQQFRINSEVSDLFFSTHDVPKGSILDPMFFSKIHIRLTKLINFFNFVLYVDDRTLLSQSLETYQLKTTINSVIGLMLSYISLVAGYM